MVSHPASIDVWREMDLSNFEELRQAGCRSYNTQTCGMHIHVSRRGNLSDLDVLKLLLLFQSNVDFIVALSRRRRANLDQWASIEMEGMPYFIKKVKGENMGRYAAINTNPRHTVEFRIFRGTLHAKAIKRNIELVNAMVQYVKHTKFGDISAETFKVWVETSEAKAVIGNKASKMLSRWFSNLKRKGA